MPEITDDDYEAVFAAARRDGHSHLVVNLGPIGRGYAVLAVPGSPIGPADALDGLIVVDNLTRDAAEALAVQLCGMPGAEVHCIEFI